MGVVKADAEERRVEWTPIPATTERPYLLLTRQHYCVDPDGRILLEGLWHKDLMLHTLYLRDLIVLAPRLRKEDVSAAVLMESCPANGARLRFVDVSGTDHGLAGLPAPIARFATIRRLLGEVEAMQPGDVSWPTGWIGCELARWTGKASIIVVEAAPWRFDERSHPSLRRRLVAFVKERMARRLVRGAAAAFFTQPAYREEFLGDATVPNAITPASWISHDDVRGTAEVERLHAEKAARPRCRFLFAARLAQEKGVDVLLEAIRLAAADGLAADVDVIGDGPERARIVAAAGDHEAVRLRLLDPLPYGAPFFDLVAAYDVVLLPNLGDEQPRIVFDAYAQGVPVIASATNGIMPHVAAGRTGWLVPRGDAAALACAMAEAAANRPEVSRRGLACLDDARSHTHLGMHAARAALLVPILEARPRPARADF